MDMNTGSRRQQYQQAQSADTPGWVLLCVTLALCLIALPCTILGFLAERFLARWLPWRLSFLLWFALLFASAFVLYNDYQQSLQHLIIRELADYMIAVRHYQTDLAHYPLRQLWAETWPVWLHTLLGIGVTGFWAELYANTRTDTARTLRQNQHHRERHAQRSQRWARRRTSQPAHLPDQIGGVMVIGVPIDDDQEEA